ncbi:MAG: ComEA family DNA-binding protein [Cyclobacteriaceae bacterium]
MFQRFKKVIRDYFSFTKKETNGFMLLFCALLFFILSPLFFPLFSFSDTDTSFIASDRQKLDSLVAVLEKRKKESSPVLQKEPITHKASVGKKVGSKPFVKSVEKQVSIIQLNKASANELQQVSGIGEKLSTRIVKFRKALGGFYSKNQLYAVYGLDSLVVEKLIKQSVALNTSGIQQINLNEASFKEINKHPYISYNETKVFFDGFRNKGKRVSNLNQLVENNIFTKEKLLQLENYLIVE